MMLAGAIFVFCNQCWYAVTVAFENSLLLNYYGVSKRLTPSRRRHAQRSEVQSSSYLTSTLINAYRNYSKVLLITDQSSCSAG